MLEMAKMSRDSNFPQRKAGWLREFTHALRPVERPEGCVLRAKTQLFLGYSSKSYAGLMFGVGKFESLLSLCLLD